MSNLSSLPGYQPKLAGRRRKGRYGVLLLQAPVGWRPSSPTSLPPSIVAATYLAKGVRAAEAAIISQAFNLSHLQRDDFTGQWACVVSARFAIAIETQPEPCSCRDHALAIGGKAVAK